MGKRWIWTVSWIRTRFVMIVALFTANNICHDYCTFYWPWYNCTGWLGVKHQVTYLLVLFVVNFVADENMVCLKHAYCVVSKIILPSGWNDKLFNHFRREECFHWYWVCWQIRLIRSKCGIARPFQVSFSLSSKSVSVWSVTAASLSLSVISLTWH